MSKTPAMNIFMGFDVGGTKTAWGTFDEKGNKLKSGRFATPKTKDAFLDALVDINTTHKPVVVGIGIAGTINSEHTGTLICTNIPHLSHLDIAAVLKERCDTRAVVDNDARCALIGEVWLGNAQDITSAVLVTLGTGIGGAVMQKGKVLPHPQDIGLEVGRIVVDSSDVFPSRNGQGTIEAFLGGKNLEERLQISLHETSAQVRRGDNEAIEIWHAISYYFIQCMQAVYNQYSCKRIIIGGIGSNDLAHYLQDPPPCEIVAAKLGELAGIYGAARLAMDYYEDEQNPDWE
jgi:glucokinase